MTPEQRKLLVFIGHYAAENGGLAPTYAEMKRELGGLSNSVYWRRVDRLIAAGYLRRSKEKSYARSIYLTDQGRDYLSEVGAFDRLKREVAAAAIDEVTNWLESTVSVDDKDDHESAVHSKALLAIALDSLRGLKGQFCDNVVRQIDA